MLLLHELVYRVLLAGDALVAVVPKDEDVGDDAKEEDAAEKLVVVVAREVLSEPAVCEERQELGVVVELHALVLMRRCLLCSLTRWCTLWSLLGIFLLGEMMFWLLIMLLIYLLIPIFEKLVMLLSIVLRKATSLPSLKVFTLFLIPSVQVLSLLPFSALLGFRVLA